MTWWKEEQSWKNKNKNKMVALQYTSPFPMATIPGLNPPLLFFFPLTLPSPPNPQNAILKTLLQGTGQ
jgi:hypothetical protein